MRAALLVALCAGALCARAAPPAGFVIEAELMPARVYVGSEALLRMRLLRAPGVPYGVLRPPALDHVADVWPLGATRWSETQRAGVTWQMHQRTYLVVPKRAGSLVVPAAQMEGPLARQLEASAREARVPLAPNATRGPQLVLEVRPIPANGGEPWLPARRLTLEERWSYEPAELSVGAPVTRTVVLHAEGLPAQRLPQIEMAAQPVLRVHHDQPELSTEHQAAGTIGRLVQRIVLVPLDEGEVVLPALSVRWWDVGMDAPRTATLEGRTLRLRAALPEAAPPAVADNSPPVMLREMAAAFALLLVAALWWYVRNEAERQARRQLRAACRANNARLAREALILWWNAVLLDAQAPLVRRMGPGWDAAARAQLGALDAALYGGRAWDGKEFWRCVRPWLRTAPLRRVGRAPALPPLFKLQATDATAGRAIARQ